MRCVWTAGELPARRHRYPQAFPEILLTRPMATLFGGNYPLLSTMHIRTIRRSITSQSLFAQLLQRSFVAPQSLRMASTLPKLPVFEAIANHNPQSTAVIHSKSGRRFTYGELLRDIADARNILRQTAGEQRLEGERVAFLVENGYDYVGAKQAVFVPREVVLIACSNPAFHPQQQ